jgi:two-component system, OmpR family, response regulator
MAGETLVLVVDDDLHIREVVRFALEKGGFRVVEAEDGKEALVRFAETQPDLIILDITMPELDGTDVCRSIRADSDVPIIFLSSRDDEIDRIVGLELGGDDYVTKPFSPRELLARARAVLRRKVAAERLEKQEPAAVAGVKRHGLLSLDLDRFKACWGEGEVTLTVTEFGILRTLLGFPGKVFSRDELISGAYHDDNHVSERTVDSHVRRIRSKFSAAGGDPMETVHGVGYRLSPCQGDQ